MICSKCNKEVPAGDSFCHYCGTPVNTTQVYGEQNNVQKNFAQSYNSMETASYKTTAETGVVRSFNSDKSIFIKAIAIVAIMILVCVGTVALNRNVKGEWELVELRKNGISKQIPSDAIIKIDENRMTFISEGRTSTESIIISDGMIVDSDEYIAEIKWSAFATLHIVGQGQEYVLSRNYTFGYILLNCFAVLILVLLCILLVKVVQRKM